MGWFDHWAEDNEDVGPLSHWDEDFSYGNDVYLCDTCIHNGDCKKQKRMIAGNDCDEWSENKIKKIICLNKEQKI